MSAKLGKHLHEYMGWRGPVTYLQHLTWMEWLLIDANDADKYCARLDRLAQLQCKNELKPVVFKRKSARKMTQEEKTEAKMAARRSQLTRKNLPHPGMAKTEPKPMPQPKVTRGR